MIFKRVYNLQYVYFLLCYLILYLESENYNLNILKMRRLLYGRHLTNTVLIYALKKLVNFTSYQLGWHWLIKLNAFQEHSSIMPQLHIVLCVRQPETRLLPSPFIPLYALFPPLILLPFSLVTTILCSLSFYLIPSPFYVSLNSISTWLRANQSLKKVIFLCFFLSVG